MTQRAVRDSLSLYASSGLLLGITVFRDLVIVQTASVGEQQAFYTFFNLVNLIALLPGNLVATLVQADFSKGLVSQLIVITVLLGIAGSGLYPANVEPLVAIAVLLCVAIACLSQLLLLRRKIIFSRSPQAITGLIFACFLLLRTQASAQWLYVIALASALGFALVVARTEYGKATEPGLVTARRAPSLLFDMSVANLGSLHFFWWQYVVLNSRFGGTQLGILSLRASSYAFSFLSIPAALLVLASACAWPREMLAVLLGLSLAGSLASVLYLVPSAISVAILTTISTVLVYLGRMMVIKAHSKKDSDADGPVSDL